MDARNHHAFKPAKRTSEGLREVLFDTLDGLASGRVDANEASAVCKVAAQIINSINAEVQAYSFVGRHHPDGAMPHMVLPLSEHERKESASRMIASERAT